ncbi:hypothetical protein C8R44DRAFT_746981 [Mycena epipterygia]|nr:hypothetical protein C8R44DRAFT_746981 [Mycena epipterygia]
MLGLYKIHTFVEAAQDDNKIKHFFHQKEMNTLLKDCQAGLEEALKVFKIYQSTANSRNSLNLFSLLPARPKIFHGWQPELEDILTSLSQGSAHIAILSAGVIGKQVSQELAFITLRFFITADSATSIELAGLTGSHLGLKPGKDLTQAVVQFLSRGPSCLLVPDNLEIPWEPLVSHSRVEEFLSLLTDILHLALIITMHGAERPAKVQWTHPFLKPLQTLSCEAAWKTFIEITDDFHGAELH